MDPPRVKEKDKGKEKVTFLEPLEAMTVKRARREKATQSDDERSMRGETSKRPSRPRRKLGITDFQLGESSNPYDLTLDVAEQGPKITWPQLLHLAPKVSRQWSKMVSTKRSKTKVAGAISRCNMDDILPIVDVNIKGKRVGNTYIDGGAQICVMSEAMMLQLGLEVDRPSPCKAKMANNAKVKCVGVVSAVKIKAFNTKVEVDLFVMLTKGEGYPLILGRPWLISMKAKQDWALAFYA
ncbi:hypothetical protein DD606_25765 [Enterobacter cloacae complex sp. GF14B]|nr:hypothetical protein DD606_25765 [Enterobacter cloacae complex sp. GF14B]